MLLQLTLIVLMSVAASYAFQRTETAYPMNGVSLYRYLTYAITVFLGYVCFSRYKKFVGLTFSLALSAAALSPVGQEAMELFPLLVPFFAVVMGFVSILVVPSSRGKGFFEFLAVLILPAVLAESRMGGFFGLLATIESIGYFEISAITASIVGGYFYLRYATLAHLSCLELLSNGGDERDVTKVSTWSNLMIILVVFGASGIAAALMAVAPIAADALRATFVALPLYVLILAMGGGIAITTILYILKLSYKEPH